MLTWNNCLGQVGWFAAILLVGIGLRIAYGELHPTLRRDEIYYIEWAQQTAGGTDELLQNKQQPPLLVFLLRQFAGGDGGKDAARRIVQILGILFIVPWWWIGKRVFGSRQGAALMMLAAAVAPYPIFMSNQILREAVALPLAAGFLLALLTYWEERKIHWALVSGAVAGIGACARYEFLECLLLLFGVMAVLMVQKRLSVKSGVLHAATAGIMALAVFLCIYACLEANPLQVVVRYGEMVWRYL